MLETPDENASAITQTIVFDGVGFFIIFFFSNNSRDAKKEQIALVAELQMRRRLMFRVGY